MKNFIEDIVTTKDLSAAEKKLNPLKRRLRRILI
jgi:hypothetical protein